MKSIRKTVSLVLCLALISVLFACVSLVPASAAAGDVFAANAIPDNWKWYTSSRVTRQNSGAQFSVNSGTNKGNGLDYYGVMISNTQSDEIILPSKTYRIQFHLSTWYQLAQLQVTIDTGTALFSRANHPQNFTSLSTCASNITGDASSTKLGADISIDVTTDSTISGNQHFVLGVIPADGGSISNNGNIVFNNITITELMSVDVINAEDSSSFGTLYCVPGDDAVTLLENAGYPERWAYDITPVPATVAADTTQISVSYTYNPQVIQNIDFGAGYGDGSYHYYPADAGSRHIALENGQMKHDASTAAPTDSNAAQHGVTLANNYLDSHLIAGGTYTLTFELSISASASIKNYLADIRFGTDIWTDVLSPQTIRYSGAALKAMVTGQRNADYSMVTYTVSVPVKLPESGWTHATARNILLSVYGGQYTLDNVTITEALPPKATYRSHSLVLGKEIGVNFTMDLSALSESEKASAVMEFVLRGKTYRQAFGDAENLGAGLYRFTCHISSVQMAESITPVFRYGENSVATDGIYSAKKYIDYVVDNSGSFASEVVDLVKALGDYGHYIQIYLAARNGWVAGTDYTALAKYRAADYTSDEKTAYLDALTDEGVAMVKTITGSAVTGVSYFLNFDSMTYINIKLSAGESLTASATVDGKTVYATHSGDFRTQGLPIIQLGDAITLRGSGSENTTEFSVTLSGLSYIRAILNSGTATTEAKNAMSSLYIYYRMACVYQDMVTGGNDSNLTGETIEE